MRFYNAVIDEFLKQGIRPILNLHHFDLPVELYEKYDGWESKHVVDLFTIFAKRCFELFGDRVKDWVTFNEPMVVVEGEYLYEFHYPKLVDGKKACQVLYNLNLASAKAIEVFHASDCAKLGGRIGIVLNLTPAYPRSDAPEDVAAAKFAEDYKNNSFLDPAVHGTFTEDLVKVLAEDGVLWESTPEELDIIKNHTVDFLGINYYQPFRAKARETPFDASCGWLPEKHFESYEMPGRRIRTAAGRSIRRPSTISPSTCAIISATSPGTFPRTAWASRERRNTATPTASSRTTTASTSSRNISNGCTRALRRDRTASAIISGRRLIAGPGRTLTRTATASSRSTSKHRKKPLKNQAIGSAMSLRIMDFEHLFLNHKN